MAGVSQIETASAEEAAPARFSLVARDLRKSFSTPAGGVVEVLRGVSLALREGEMVAVRGASGTGKSTLLHVLGGLEAAEAGTVRLDDFDVTGAGGVAAAHFRNTSIGFVFQFHHLLSGLTAIENVALPLLIARRGLAQARDEAALMLARVGLAERAAHGVAQLSGGEQQRVAIARALVTGPRLVLADEPTGNLDARTGEEIGALLLSLCRTRRASMLIATHNEALAQTCDRVLVLHDGRLAETEASTQNP